MNHPLSDMMTNSMSKIRDMIDVNTVVGDPITTPGGVTIIPVTKVSIGYGGGGSDVGDYGMHLNRKLSAWYLAAGNGVYKLLFTALRVLGAKHGYLHPFAAGSGLAHGFNGLHLVVLYGYYAALYAQGAHLGP